jgi:hypothetical protein
MRRYLLAIGALALVLAQSASAQIFDSTTGQQIIQCPTCSGVGATLSNVIVQDAVTSGNTIGVNASKQAQVLPQPFTSGGLSVLRAQVAANTTSVAVKASAGQLYGIEAFNNSSTIAYIKLYNAAQGSTTCGAGTPVYQGMIPAAAAGGNYVSMNVYGLPFGTAITACVTTGFADNDTTAPAASTYVINYFYK